MLSRELWGQQKRETLLASLDTTDFDAQYNEAKPAVNNRFSLRPRSIGEEYESWPLVVELCALPPSLGILENRGGALIDIEKDVLRDRMKEYYDESRSFEQLEAMGMGLTKSYARFDPVATRKKVLTSESFNNDAIIPLFVRPFDIRWCYYTETRPVWNEKRPFLAQQNFEGNKVFISRRKQVAKPEGTMMYCTSVLGAQHALHTDAYYFPFLIRDDTIAELAVNEQGQMVEERVTTTTANLSAQARDYLIDLGLASPDSNHDVAALIWHHALAIGYASLYRQEHGDGLSGDWPRIPLPADAQILRDSSLLGSQVAALLDLAVPFDGIESGSFRRELDPFGLLSRADGKSVDAADTDLNLHENWGFFGPRGIVQPGDGKITIRDASPKERDSMTKLGITDIPRVCDIALNEKVYWSGVPLPVWETIIGGYQVLKKWLSYRDERIIGRPLHDGEAQQFESTIRRLTLLWSMTEALNTNYSACASNVWPWNPPESVSEAANE